MSQRVSTALRLLRQNPRAFLSELAGQVERYFVYSADPRAVAAPAPADGWAVRKLTDDALRALPSDCAEWRHEIDRFHRLGFNDAYLLTVDGAPASIGWLIPSADYRRLPVRFLALRNDEAEIGFCVTHSELRGRGLYPHLVRDLCRTAAASGVRRVFVITGQTNVASQRGIEKAGFARCGTIVHRVLWYLHPNARLISRRYR